MRPIRREVPSGDDLQRDWDDLSQAAAGNEVAFARLVRRHERRLYRLSWRLLGDAARAEEAVQDVFLKLYLKAGSFEPRGQLYSLLYRMTTNHCLNRLRRRRLARFLSLSEHSGDPAAIDPIDPAPSPARRQEAEEQWRQTRSHISRLPAGQQAVLVLVKIEGLSYREAAATLGVSLGAVESRLFRAMRTLERAAFEVHQQGADE